MNYPSSLLRSAPAPDIRAAAPRRPASAPRRPITTLLTLAALASVIWAACVVFDNQTTPSPVWYGPYLSAAKNVSWGGPFLADVDEVKAFAKLAPAERHNYRFTSTSNLTNYIANPIAFAYAVGAAKRLFSWLPDERALEAFQVLLHVLLCLAVVAALRNWMEKTLFFLLYAINPLVINFVTYPHYYFYQAIPSFGLVLLLLARNRSDSIPMTVRSAAYLVFCCALGVVLLIRSTTAAAIAAFFVVAFLSIRPRTVFLVGLVAFATVVATGYSPSQKNFWHTAYVGVGAYPNAHVEGLSDDNGYALYLQRTGEPLNASLGGNYYDEKVMARYRDVSRSEFLGIARDDPGVLVRNAALNTLQGFTIGYLVGQPYVVHVAMALAGLLVAGLLLYTGQYVLTGLVLTTIATFVPYYPPIPAYMYGAYLLLVVGLIRAVEFGRAQMRQRSPETE